MFGHLRAFVFDFDGTVAATHIDFAAMREDAYGLLREFGVFSDELTGHMVLEMVALAQERLGPDSEEALELGRRIQAVLQRREIEAAKRGAPVPGVPEALAALRRQGKLVGVITRNCRAAVAAFTARYPLEWDALVTRDEARAVKPDPAHLLQALEELGVAPGEAAMVGDHWSDIACGRDAGVWTIGVLTSQSTPERLREAGANLVIESAALVPAQMSEVGEK